MLTVDRDFQGEILDALDSGLVILGPDGRVETWNLWMASATGISSEVANNRTLSELFTDRKLGRLTSAIRDALDFGASSLLTHLLRPGLLPLKTRSGRRLIHNVAVRPV